MEIQRSSSSPVQSTQKPTQIQKTAQSEQQSQSNETQQAQRYQSSEPKPVVNTQGQTTGRLLNVTA